MSFEGEGLEIGDQMRSGAGYYKYDVLLQVARIEI